MTFAAIVLAVIIGLVWFVTSGPVVIGSLTVYILAFAIGLLVAVAFAIGSRERRNILGAGVLVLNFFGSHYAWSQPDPVLLTALLDLATAAYFVLAGATRWELAIGGLYLASVGIAALTAWGLIPSHLARPPTYLAFSFPDLTSAIGHIANATLGFASGDTGLGIQRVLGKRPAFLGPSKSVLGALRTRIAALR